MAQIIQRTLSQHIRPLHRLARLASALPASALVSARAMSSQRFPDKLLFTPGPLTTSISVKEAMLHDYGSRDAHFIDTVKHVRDSLLSIANVSPTEFTTILMQGSGTFGVESVVSTVVDKQSGGLLVIANGAYGERIAKIAAVHHVPHHVLSYDDNVQPSLTDIEHVLQSSQYKHITHVAVVHSETTSGIINDITSVGQLCHRYGKSLIVDAMSSFGGVPVDMHKAHIDYLVSSANKCIEGVPGFAFIIAKLTAISRVNSANSSTLSLNIVEQLKGLDKDGQFRFTPPTHSLLAFNQALRELESEGGVAARSARYQANQRALMAGMKPLGFELYLPSELQGWIISGYRYPTDSNWNFAEFYRRLNDKGFIIYPGKVSKADCFRIGHIGRLSVADTEKLLVAIDEVCRDMKTAKYYSQ